MNYYDEERDVPKHKKKVQKTVRKSNHKHNYQLFEIKDSGLNFIGKNHLIRQISKCVFCGKEKFDSVFLTEEEWREKQKTCVGGIG